jgi:class 3 adenylate cyclase
MPTTTSWRTAGSTVRCMLSSVILPSSGCQARSVRVRPRSGSSESIVGFHIAARNIAIRAGIHIGECERRGEEWSGVAVHIEARVGVLADTGEVITSRTVRDLSAGSGLAFESLGPHQLKGIPEQIEICRVTTT